MKRALFYAVLIALFSCAVYMKIENIKESRNAPTISIANEMQEHGKPVELFQVAKENLKFYERATGDASGSRVRLFVSKLQWDRIRRGQEARALDKDGNTLNGRVIEVGKVRDSETGLYKVVVGLDGKLKQARNVVVDINTKTLPQVLMAPSAAIRKDGRQSNVWVLTDGKALKRPVEVGEESERYTQILKGLQVGEQVIVRGASSLKKGDRVRIVNRKESGENNND